jgi:hypothetical protein
MRDNVVQHLLEGQIMIPLIHTSTNGSLEDKVLWGGIEACVLKS